MERRFCAGVLEALDNFERLVREHQESDFVDDPKIKPELAKARDVLEELLSQIH